MSLPPEVRARYIAIIDAILAGSDLETISEKRIRQGIQGSVEYDITPQKAAIKALILERFDIFNARQNGATVSKPVQSIEKADSPYTNGHATINSRTATPAKREAESDETSEIADEARPKKKKRKPSVDNDAVLAARLQAEEDKLARPTRNGSARKSANVKKKRAPKKKTAARVTGSDDSEVEDGVSERKVNRDTGFHKPLSLSPGLAALFGEPTMSRPQVTKHIWKYIKEHQLQDPSDKRFIVCDEQLRGIFKQDKVHMFTMTKLLNQQMYAIDE